jgi:predicted DNA-binding ribbon-helix-helix protein
MTVPRKKRKSATIPSDGFKKRVVQVDQHCSLYINLDDANFDALKEIAKREGVTVGQICQLAALKRNPDVELSRAVRSFILQYFREAATEDGHRGAGHGSRR